MKEQDVFHAGERIIQERTGEVKMAQTNSRIIQEEIVPGAFNFLERQAMVVLSTQDKHGKVWVSVLMGAPGFVKVPDSKVVTIDLRSVATPPQDIALTNLANTGQVGMLFIELATRRRIRINGTASHEGDLLTVQVQEAYPNCPKYIQRRVLHSDTGTTRHGMKLELGTRFSLGNISLIRQADTMFVGSVAQTGYLDASHRGGPRGFVEVLDDKTLKIPDYKGNSMFNTLGNFVEDARAGLIFLDFDRGEMLQLTGRAKLLFDQFGAQDMNRTTGTGRYWLFHLEEWMSTQATLPFRWEYVDASPLNPDMA